MTKLEAINRILISMGELPVEELDESLTEVALASTHIDMASREVQLDSWYFNTEWAVLIPDNKGHILIPFDVVRVIDLPPHISVIHNKLYDNISQSFIFKRDIQCRIIKVLDFEDIPATFALWITLRAAKKYQNNTLTSPSLAENLQREETEAMLSAKREHREITRPNVMGRNGKFSIAKVLRRDNLI